MKNWGDFVLFLAFKKSVYKRVYLFLVIPRLFFLLLKVSMNYIVKVVIDLWELRNLVKKFNPPLWNHWTMKKNAFIIYILYWQTLVEYTSFFLLRNLRIYLIPPNNYSAIFWKVFHIFCSTLTNYTLITFYGVFFSKPTMLSQSVVKWNFWPWIVVISHEKAVTAKNQKRKR